MQREGVTKCFLGLTFHEQNDMIRMVKCAIFWDAFPNANDTHDVYKTKGCHICIPPVIFWWSCCANVNCTLDSHTCVAHMCDFQCSKQEWHIYGPQLSSFWWRCCANVNCTLSIHTCDVPRGDIFMDPSCHLSDEDVVQMLIASWASMCNVMCQGVAYLWIPQSTCHLSDEDVVQMFIVSGQLCAQNVITT